MRSRQSPSRQPPTACSVLLVAVLTQLHPAGAAAGDAGIALHCRLSSGLTANYLFSRAEATVRRVDLLQPRRGRAHITATEYRFDFRDFSSTYRIEVIVDRETGNTRRVFGTRDAMDRMPAAGGGVPGLVYEAGQCRERN